MHLKLKKMNRLIAFLFKKVTAVTLGPWGIYFAKGPYITIPTIVNHERTHEAQQFELMFILFYVWYVLEWIIKSILIFGNAYRSISFEVEAYRYDHILNYNSIRKPYAWIKFLFVLYPKK